MLRSKTVALVVAISLSPLPGIAWAAPPATTPDGYPKTQSSDVGMLTIYQPQVDSWDGNRLVLHAACSVLPPGAKAPVFGVITMHGNTQVDKPSRSVLFHDAWIEKASFPSAVSKADDFKKAFTQMLPPSGQEIPLDRLEADLLISKAEVAQLTQPVKNDPPQIIISPVSAVIVHVDGEPVWAKVDGTPFERIVNTRALVMRTSWTSDLYLHILSGWMVAPSLTGTWVKASTMPAGADAAAENLAKANAVDLMDAQPDKGTSTIPTLATAQPKVIVATRPAELIVTEGPIDWMPLEGTNLIYVRNTTGNIFMDMEDQAVYVLISGRWFHAKTVDGPWAFVPPNSLPTDFDNIPDNSPKENVKASIPGTVQAREAVIAAEIPQTAVIYPDKVKFTSHLVGDPIVLPVDGTSLSYVANSPDPIIEVGPMQWYAEQSGVWFTATAVKGPWRVAMSVPPAIYAIPTSSPIHYVTYVQIYDSFPDYVVVGYTPGYVGAMITPYGTVVYGTGYLYAPYIAGSVWIAPPPTYGYAMGMTYTPWTGWTYGYGVGWGWGSVAIGVGIGWAMATAPCWGPMPYYYHPYYGGAAVYHGGAAVWGPSGWAATTGNVYSHYGSTSAVTRSSAGYNAWTGNAWSSQVGHSYNSVTGQQSAGQRSSVANAYTGNYASAARGGTYNPSTGTAAVGSKGTVGNAYTGKSASYAHGAVVGPGGGATASAAHVNDNYYGSKDGNVYKYNGQSGNFQQYNKNGGWDNATSERSQSLSDQQSARNTGETRSFGSGSTSFGGGGGSFGGGGGGGFGGGGGGGFGGGGGGFHGAGGWGGGGGGGWGGGGGFRGGGGGFRR